MNGKFDYRAAFREGHERNRAVADRIAELGIWVDCPPLRFAHSLEEIQDFTKHEKDVVTRAGVIEVKGQRRDFSADVHKFPFPDLIVDTVESWEGKIEKPIAYVFVSMTSGAMIAIPGRTYPKWSVRTMHDRYKDRDIDFFVADRSCLVTFDRLLEHLVAKDAAFYRNSRD